MDFIKDQETSTASKKGKKMVINDVETGKPVMYKLKGDKEARECFLVLLGPESYKMRMALVESANRDKAQKEGTTKSEEEVNEEIESDAKMLAGLTVGGQLPLDDVWVEVTPEVAEKALVAVMSLRRQATQFALNLGNFRNK